MALTATALRPVAVASCHRPAARCHAPGRSAVPVLPRRAAPGRLRISARRPALLVRAGGRDEVQGKLEGVVKRANGVVDGIVDLVPESVPRGTARIAVIGGGVLLVFTILQKIISTVITVAVLVAAGWFFLNVNSGERSALGEDIDAGDADDPVKKARSIMDKYK
eukprot:jgi/Tetstr1/428772/TSEL_018760.t1